VVRQACTSGPGARGDARLMWDGVTGSKHYLRPAGEAHEALVECIMNIFRERAPTKGVRSAAYGRRVVEDDHPQRAKPR
jgi:hypothetical protein